MGVWDFATKRKNPVTKELEAQCNSCPKIIKCSGNSTTSLKNHLQTIHGIDVNANSSQKEKPEVEVNPKKQKTISEFLTPKKKLKEIVSDLATDNISICAITRNNYIRDSITKDGFKLPANASDVMKLVHEDFDEKRQKLVDLIKEKVSDSSKLSMSIDEVTTARGRRFFGINLHDKDGKTFKTGLVRIFGSCNAEQQLKLIEDHLSTFGIVLDRDIVASTQDGASVNKKFINISTIKGQFCLNHAIHLGVCDTLYTKEIKSNNHETEPPALTEDEFCDVDFEEVLEDDEVIVNYHETLKKCREITKFIKNSTVRNHVFQTKVKQNQGKEIELHLDVKTRWNSISSMLAPLIKTENEIIETLEEFKSMDMVANFSFESIKTLQEALDPVKVAVENLSKENSTLLSADLIIKFMLEKLSKLNSEISKKLLDNLRIRVNERLDPELMPLIRCLKDPNVNPTKDTINFAGKMLTRLFNTQNVDVEVLHEPSEIVHSNSEENLTLQQELSALLENNSSVAPKVHQDNGKWLKSEFTLFKNTGQHTENLQRLYQALLSNQHQLTLNVFFSH